MASLYCDIDLQEYFFLLEKESTLYTITDEFYDLTLNLEDDEILELVEKNPIAKYFMKRDSGNLYGDKMAFTKIQNEEYDDFATDLIILPNDADVNKIRQEEGVLALHIDAPFLDTQSVRFGYTINNEADCKFKCWDDVTKPRSFVPINSAIVIDNFLWNDKIKFHQENLENLYPLISGLVSDDLKVPFELLINIDNRKSGLKKNEAEEKCKKIKSNLEKITGKEFRVGISSHTNSKLFHSRVILTNHHFFWSDRGFSVFKNGRVPNSTFGNRNWVFLDIENYEGEIDKHQHFHHVKNISKSIDFNKKVNNDTIYNVGNYKNRLLN